MQKKGIHVAPLGPRVPRWGNWLTRTFGRTVVRLFGWRVDGAILDREKFVVLVAPHTTGWDFGGHRNAIHSLFNQVRLHHCIQRTA